MEILIATTNEAKIKKYSTILDVLKINYKTLNDFEKKIEVEENGKTPRENSIIKAKAYYKDKQPGVYVRSFNKGKELTDEEVISVYSKEIQKVGGETTGGFIIAITIIDKNGKIHTAENNHRRFFKSIPCKERTPGYPMNSLIYNQDTKTYLAQEYKGEKIYKGNSFEKDLEFIKSVLLDNEVI